MPSTLVAFHNALPAQGASLTGGGSAWLLRLIIACVVLLSFAAAQAQSIVLAGMLGKRALLVVGGSLPKSLSAGESYQDVKVISTDGDQAVVEQAGKRITLRVGSVPVSMNTAKRGETSNSNSNNSRIVLTAGTGGHFVTPGQVNGKTVQFMVDTGATSVSMSSADAERAGISYKDGQPIRLSTSNGTAQGYLVKLDSVRVGEVEVYSVDAVVSPQAMPYMLLGNSFLTRFQMMRENDQMTLTKRY